MNSTPSKVPERESVAKNKLTKPAPYDPSILPPGIRSRLIDNVNGLAMHILEAGFEKTGQPAIVLLHGFPELAYSFRKIMLPLAAAGFHVIAPDRRGYGRTCDSIIGYDEDFTSFGTLNQITDIVELVQALGHSSAACLIGHDQGSSIAAWCAVVRPDIFRSLVMMSVPFGGFPTPPANSPPIAPAISTESVPTERIDEDLAALNPPRKYYQRYFTTREANEDLWHPPQGIHDLFRAYYHMKSAQWKPNAPFPLKEKTASEWAKLPRYYVMDLDKTMSETVAPALPSADEISSWLPDEELRVSSTEYGRTGFQGGLNGYRVGRNGQNAVELRPFSARTVDVPSLFIAGKSDWAVYQIPGAFESMQKSKCTQLQGVHFVDGAGHWVQQEQPDAVNRLLAQFLQSISSGKGA